MDLIESVKLPDDTVALKVMDCLHDVIPASCCGDPKTPRMDDQVAISQSMIVLTN